MKKIPNTFGLDVYTDIWLEYDSKEELKRMLADSLTLPYLHIGAGSNLLFEKDYPGTILHSLITGVEIVEETAEKVLVRVGAGMLWDDFVAYCVEQGWYGAENLSLIPGEVGAAAVQNIGAYGVEVSELIFAVETVNIQGEQRVYGVDECAYSYRKSLFKQQDMKHVFITHVCFCLSKKEYYTLGYGFVRQELEKCPTIDLKRVRQVIMTIRESKLPDPKVVGNAGSFFMNPIVSNVEFEELYKKYPHMPFYELPDGRVKVPAGWLIEQCGWKGKALGAVAVHDKQALVLVNLGGATGADVVNLSQTIQKAVYEKFTIAIYPEVEFIGYKDKIKR